MTVAAAWFAVVIIHLAQGLPQETLPTSDYVVTADTTILFSNFYSPSTAPPPTTLDDVPEPETGIYDLERGRLVDDHPCRRDCGEAEPMNCKYRFDVTLYHSLSKACFNCPSNTTDCFREDCVTADGISRALILVNKKLPGPMIEVCEGDSVEIELVNHLVSDTTSIHWHGIHQKESPYMDGVPYVSQCPVLPRSSFLYRYYAANSGTHFWHSHSGSQRGDGMFGALIVRPKNDNHRALYDEDLSEHMILTTDWSNMLMTAMFSGHYNARLEGKPPTLIVNGRGLNGAPPASFTVKEGLRYRFRLINAGVLNCPIELSIDDHYLTVISTDGTDIKPVTVQSLVSYAGERWDFILTADQPVGNYWMRFRGLMDCDARFTSAHTASVLHYSGSDHHLPSGNIAYSLGNFTGIKLNPLNEKPGNTSISIHELHSLVPKDRTLQQHADRTIYLSYDFHPIDNPHFYKTGRYGFYEVANKNERVLTPQINHVSLKLPPFPLLSQFTDLNPRSLCSHQNLTGCSERYCECINIIELNLGEVVELVLVDIGKAYDANHPFHIHGHAFRVVAVDRVSNTTTVEEVMALDRNGSIKRNLIDPPLKDTVAVHDGGYTIVRFIADNPGYWMFHCHLEFHVEVGMAVIFKVGSHSEFPPVPENFPRCGNYISPPLPTKKLLPKDHDASFDYNSTKTNSSFDVSRWWTTSEPSGCSTAMISSYILWISLVYTNYYYFVTQ